MKKTTRKKKTTRRRKSPFAGIRNAHRPGGGSPYIVPGDYHYLVDKCILRDGVKGEFFIVEGKVLFSRVRKGQPERPVGSHMSWVVNMSQLSSQGNVRAFVAEATGDDFDEIGEEDCDAAVSKKNPIKGCVFRIKAHTIKTRAKKDFTLVGWELIGDMSDYRRLYPASSKKKSSKKKTTKKKTSKRRPTT